MKDEYCKKNNIYLHRISYKEINKINLEFLLSIKIAKSNLNFLPFSVIKSLNVYWVAKLILFSFNILLINFSPLELIQPHEVVLPERKLLLLTSIKLPHSH